MGSQMARSLSETGRDVVVFDKLTYAGDRANLEGVKHDFVEACVCDGSAVRAAMDGVDVVIHMAAESHVENSLHEPDQFLQTNVVGARVMLSEACAAGVEQFVHVSTDEVFGQALPDEYFGPNAPMKPGNAYAASKVGAEALVHAWRHTYDYPVTMVRCTNNFGPRQHPEKAIPCWILAGLGGGPIPVHGEGVAVRDWLYVEDFARGVIAALDGWQDGATWHFAGRNHRQNKQMADNICQLLGASGLQFGPERTGQDYRYALDDEYTRSALGWRPQVSVEDALHSTIDWYRTHGQRWGR
ncbi:MAG: dTDP-glucose 4,6-dehydratase [Deltaproteobacteria bacterium]|nr:dTDP-glucose 4,6-dehydratase [Deltaproteobacteria bacterium]